MNACCIWRKYLAGPIVTKKNQVNISHERTDFPVLDADYVYFGRVLIGLFGCNKVKGETERRTRQHNFHLYAWVFPAFGANYVYFGRALVKKENSGLM